MSQFASSVSEPLQSPATSQARAEIVDQFWSNGTTASLQSGDLEWDAYFAYYRRECSAALVHEGRHLSARTHGNLIEIVHLLQAGLAEDQVKHAIRQTLTQQQRQPEDENSMLDGSIKLAARLFLMINIGPLPSEVLGALFLPWNCGSLQDAVHNHFNDAPEADPSSDHDVIRMDLTVRNIDHNSKIEIVPTDNLVDHLRLVERGKKLCVFHHVFFLKKMKSTQSPMFPEGFIDETLDTLTLLFPEPDRKVREWFDVASGTNSQWAQIDRGMIKCGHFGSRHPARRLKRYRFWRDRLVTLQEAADEALYPSKALLKALKDNKREDRWFNSWVATVAIVLALFFGLVQSIEGAIQVYKAYHPTKG